MKQVLTATVYWYHGIEVEIETTSSVSDEVIKEAALEFVKNKQGNIGYKGQVFLSARKEKQLNDKTKRLVVR